MKALKIAAVVGARPNFMKVDPVFRKLKSEPAYFDPVLVHTGQHYDQEMSGVFFEELDMYRPDIHLGVGSGSHAGQTARIMLEFERVCQKIAPDIVLVGGDVNSTLACSLVAAKLNIPVAHIEAGLRSFDRTMPEEINRIVTDSISSYLFATCQDAVTNLRKEGIADSKIRLVGNTMIDTLRRYERAASSLQYSQKLGVEKNQYTLVTLHRPCNVDDREILRQVIEALQEVSKLFPIVFPLHPRTKERLKNFNLWSKLTSDGIRIVQPLGYLAFLSLIMEARIVITDSGGIQEETTVLGIPCITLRPNTERPITISQGTNRLVSSSTQEIVNAFRSCVDDRKKAKVPPLWDGKAADRIVRVFSETWCETDERIAGFL